MRGRPKDITTIASALLAKSCIGAGKAAIVQVEYATDTSTYYGAIIRENGVTRAYRPMIRESAKDAPPVPLARVSAVPHEDAQNGMPFQGYIDCDGMPVAFYGSPESYVKCKNL